MDRRCKKPQRHVGRPSAESTSADAASSLQRTLPRNEYLEDFEYLEEVEAKENNSFRRKKQKRRRHVGGPSAKAADADDTSLLRRADGPSAKAASADEYLERLPADPLKYLEELREKREATMALREEQNRLLRIDEEKLLEEEQRVLKSMPLSPLLGPCKDKLRESILIVGGNYSWDDISPTLDMFSPSHDVLRPLQPMSCPRTRASVAILAGKLYVFGGFGGFGEYGKPSTTYDTVESYDVQNNQWTQCPSLNREKTDTPAVALNDKLFVLGGGYCEVEMFDPYVGKWSFGPSMKPKRVGCSAVEFQGAIYAVGGSRGGHVCAERYDPREPSWTSINSTEDNRCWHSLVVLNKKLYAIGGTNGGSRYLPTVEIYDPRKDEWTMGQPMNIGRAEFVGAVVNESIYATGGLKDNISCSDRNIVDTIECYKEGQGWKKKDLKAVGKSYACSGIADDDDELIYNHCLDYKIVVFVFVIVESFGLRM